MPLFIALAIFTLTLWLPTMAYAGTTGPKKGCNLPTSDAEALLILNNYYPGYWWDHTDLTIAVQAHPRAPGADHSDPRGHRHMDDRTGPMLRWSDHVD